MKDTFLMTDEELQKKKKALQGELAILLANISEVNSQIFLRDNLRMEAQAEAAYRKGKNPTDPPTLKEYWAQKNKKE